MAPSQWSLSDMALRLLVGAMIILKLAFIADLSVQISYAPHDDSLYVERAMHLLLGEAFGPYTSQVLVKYPGMSLWLAGARELGIPFLISVNALYVAAGVYFLLALRRCGTSRLVVLATAALYLFNPLTFGYEWFRVLREPLSTGLVVAMVAAMIHIYASVSDGRHAWRDVVIFALAFAFALFVREDDRLLWALFAMFACLLAWQMVRARRLNSNAARIFLAFSLIAPAAAAKVYEYGLRSFVEQAYGARILHDSSEGEYPKLLAAIRAIESKKDNRLVMVTQERLLKLRDVVPEFSVVIDRLPPPGPTTFSCTLQGVCTEWSNGWMPFWIKDAAFRAGLTPTLPAAQEYFRTIREKIEHACEQGRLRCKKDGEGLLPPMAFRWTRAFVGEGYRLLKMTLLPDPNVIGAPPLLYDVPVELGRKFQTITMTHHFDSQWQTSFKDVPSARAYVNKRAQIRAMIVKPYQMLAGVLLVLAFGLLTYRLWISDRVPLSPLAAAAMAFGLYSLLRLAALTYVSVFLGPFDSRMVFSTYTVCVLLALPSIAEALQAAKAVRLRTFEDQR